jgi:methyl-accepting chemotaxis protein
MAAKMTWVFILIWFAVTLGLVFQANLWIDRARAGAALAQADRLIAEMKRGDPAPAPLDLGDYAVRPFVVDARGRQVEGTPLAAEEIAFLKSNRRLLGADQWLAQGSLPSTLARFFSRWEPLPETARMPGDEAGRRYIKLVREPLTGGKHPGAVAALAASSVQGEESRRGFILLLVFWAIAFIIVGMYTVWLARDIGGPVRALKSSVEKSARQARFERLPLDSDDETGELTASFNRMGSILNQRLQERTTHLSSVSGAMSNLGQVMDRLGGISSEQASDASEQAVSMHEISTTSEEIAATLRVIAENAQSVEQVAGKSLDACRTGQGQLDEVVVGMDAATSRSQEVAQRMLELQEQANRIEGILHFIQDISEKMNLIALNASIEASGAGEAGRRFGIIAQEMRKLAEKTMSDTKEVQTLFSDLQAATGKAIIATEEGEKKVTAARKISDKASEVFQNIVHWAGETARAAHEIAISSSQQTTATDHLASALGEIKEVASRFAERSKMIETSVVELENIGSELKSLLGESEETAPAIKEGARDQ